jgi:hypothetical protein
MGKVIDNILQEFCDKCGKVISIPQQSSAKLRQLREDQAKLC